MSSLFDGDARPHAEFQVQRPLDPRDAHDVQRPHHHRLRVCTGSHRSAHGTTPSCLRAGNHTAHTVSPLGTRHMSCFGLTLCAELDPIVHHYRALGHTCTLFGICPAPPRRCRVCSVFGSSADIYWRAVSLGEAALGVLFCFPWL
jgi:hypothetical protein